MPWWNRPSVRLEKEGVDKLNPAELLSLIIWNGNKDENAIDMSNRLLNKYSFGKLSDLSLAELETEVDKIKAIKIKAMFEIFKITNKVKSKGFKPTIENAKDVYNYFVDYLKDERKEHLYILMLDSKNRIIKHELISIGTLDSSLVHPINIFQMFGKFIISPLSHTIMGIFRPCTPIFRFFVPDKVVSENYPNIIKFKSL